MGRHAIVESIAHKGTKRKDFDETIGDMGGFLPGKALRKLTTLEPKNSEERE